MYEDRLRYTQTGSFQEIHRSDGIGIKVFKGDLCGKIMRWLSGRMHDGIRPQLNYKLVDTCAVTNIKFMVNKISKLRFKTPLIPTCIAAGAEKYGSSVVIDSMNGPSMG
jgi:hypothetical protein